MSTLINRIRFYHYISGVLANQQTDPLCGMCKAYANTLSALREGLARLGNEHTDERASLSEEVLCMYEEARNRIAAMPAPENASGQKKAGNCKMPEGVCFIKSSKAMWDRIEGERPNKH
jgi:hypothetical protein